MKAIVQDRYGSADVLRLKEIAPPVNGPDEVLVRVHAAGVDPSVWHVMTGKPYAIRLMGFGLRTPKRQVPGIDLSGRVEAVGANVKDFAVGDEVFGGGEGSFAELARAKVNRLARKPENLTFEEAAAIPVSACTALQALRDRGKLQAGQRVLVIGAGGGVGSFAVQLAKALGAKVTGVCSTGKLELVRSLGADRVVDYTKESLAAQGDDYDLIVDTAGNRPLRQIREVLARKGTLVIVGGEGGGPFLGGVSRSMGAPMRSSFTGQRLVGLFAQVNTDDLRTLTELVEAGRVRPLIDRVYRLEEAPRAIAAWEAGHARGKAVLTLAS